MSLRDIKNILLKNKILFALRYSNFGLKTWLLFRPTVLAKLNAEGKYYENFIENLKPGNHIVFDIGANEGFVSETFLKKKHSVIAVEPDSRNVEILSARFAKNIRFHLLPFAAGSNPGTSELYLQKQGTAFSTMNPKWKALIEQGGYRFHFLYEPESRKIQLITIDQLIKEFGVPAFIKLDVEGYESEVIKGLNQQIPLLAFEANLPEFIAETIDCLDHLYRIDNKIVFNYSYAFGFGSEKFFNLEDFKRVLSSLDHPCVDIICVMSNYKDYYQKLPAVIPVKA